MKHGAKNRSNTRKILNNTSGGVYVPVRVTVGDSGLCCCTCVTSEFRALICTPLCVDLHERAGPRSGSDVLFQTQIKYIKKYINRIKMHIYNTCAFFILFVFETNLNLI